MTVVVEAVHVVKPVTNTAFDRWVEWYGNDVIPALKRNGFDVLGAFKRSTGRMGEDVLLSRFENMTAYEQAGLSLRKDEAFLKSAANIANEWTIVESAKSAMFVPYATEARLEYILANRPAQPRHYLQAVLQVKMGGQPAAYDAIAKIADAFEAGGAARLATAYETTMGLRGELTDLWALERAPDFSYRPGDPLAELMVQLRKAAPEETMCILNPLPYSPMQ